MNSKSDCEETFDAEFRIYGNDLIPENITKRLNIEPTSFHRKGDTLEMYGLKSPPVTTGGWFLSTAANGLKSTSLDEHVRWLLAILEPQKAEIATLLKENHSIRIDCSGMIKRISNVETIFFGHDFRSTTLSGIADLNIPLRVLAKVLIPPVTRLKRRSK